MCKSSTPSMGIWIGSSIAREATPCAPFVTMGNALIPCARLITSGMELKIREAALSDAPLIAAFNVRLADESEGLRLDAATAQAGVAAMLKDPAKGIYYVAEVEGAVVGQVMITYEWSRSEEHTSE